MSDNEPKVTREEFEEVLRLIQRNNTSDQAAESFINTTFEKMLHEYCETVGETYEDDSVTTIVKRFVTQFGLQNRFHMGLFEELAASTYDSNNCLAVASTSNSNNGLVESKPTVSPKKENDVPVMVEKKSRKKLKAKKAVKVKPSAETVAEWQRQQEILDQTFNVNNKDEQSELPERRYAPAEMFICNAKVNRPSKKNNEK